jgi:hypothetical protein
MGGGGWASEMEMKMVAKLGAVRGGGATGWLISAGGGGGAENQIRV